jgi:uncharacterized protein
MNRDQLPFIHTSLGTKWFHSCPLPEDVHIEFIAHSLARLCRFAGHVNCTMYSVAEHSVRVSYICPPEHQPWALLHDAAESVCVDVPRPLKYAEGMSAYKCYEKLSQGAIMEHFGLPKEGPAKVRLADDRLLVTEQRDLMPMGFSSGNTQEERWANAEPLPEKIEPWSTEQAERTFLMRFYELFGTREFYPHLKKKHYALLKLCDVKAVEEILSNLKVKTRLG